MKLHVFTCILHEFTCIFMYLPDFASFYIPLHDLKYIHLHEMYMYLHVFTWKLTINRWFIT